MIRSFGRTLEFWARQFADELRLSLKLTLESAGRPFVRRASAKARVDPDAGQFPPLRALSRELDLRIFAANDLGARPSAPPERTGAGDRPGGGALPFIPLP